MAKYNVSKSFQWAGTITDKVGKVMRMFGVSYDRLTGHRDSHRCEGEFGDGDTGFYQSADARIDIAMNGVNDFSFTDDNFTIHDGRALNMTYGGIQINGTSSTLHYNSTIASFVFTGYFTMHNHCITGQC